MTRSSAFATIRVNPIALVIVAVLVIVAPVSFVESKPPPHIPLVPPFWKDISYLSSQPDFCFVMAGLSVSPTVIKRGFDTEESELNEHWGKSAFANGFFKPGQIIGNAVVPMAGSIALTAAGKVFHSERIQLFGSNLFRVEAVNGLITGAMKVVISRTRPNGGKYSYPSGHSSVAFSTAAVITNHLGWKWGVPSFAAAAYVGISRMQENKHFLSDVVAGGILGTYIGFRLSRHQAGVSKLIISPSFSEGTPMLHCLLKL
jgi:hypothetical protein